MPVREISSVLINALYHTHSIEGSNLARRCMPKPLDLTAVNNGSVASSLNTLSQITSSMNCLMATNSPLLHSNAFNGHHHGSALSPVNMMSLLSNMGQVPPQSPLQQYAANILAASPLLYAAATVAASPIGKAEHQFGY